jgi:ribose-phosphate pyrophosphokinase
MVTLELGLYPDNTPVVDLERAWNATDENAIMLLRPNSLQEFVTGMLVADSFRERGRRIKNLILPCIPGARQDRIKWEGDWLFTLKSVANMINAQGFDKVMTLDPHSLASSMINNLEIVDVRLRHMIEEVNPGVKYDGIIAPDLGASKRAEDAAKQFDVPVYHATKVRDPRTNKLSGFKMIDTLIPAMRYLVVDDLCDGGGTFVGLADNIRTVYGVHLDLYVTHGLFTKGTSALEQRYENIYATDSITINNPPVKVLEVSEGLVTHV